jgi:hypothetical protein
VNSIHCFTISQSQGKCDSSKQEKQKIVPHGHFTSLAILFSALIETLHLGFGHDFISLLVTMKFLTKLLAKILCIFFSVIHFLKIVLVKYKLHPFRGHGVNRILFGSDNNLSFIYSM